MIFYRGDNVVSHITSTTQINIHNGIQVSFDAATSACSDEYSYTIQTNDGHTHCFRITPGEIYERYNQNICIDSQLLPQLNNSYESVIQNALQRNTELFPTHDEICRCWAIVDKIL